MSGRPVVLKGPLPLQAVAEKRSFDIGKKLAEAHNRIHALKREIVEIRRRTLLDAADRAEARGGIVRGSMLREMAEESA